jgi:hypothetical protein
VEAAGASKALVPAYQTARRHMVQSGGLHNHCNLPPDFSDQRVCSVHVSYPVIPVYVYTENCLVVNFTLAFSILLFFSNGTTAPSGPGPPYY